ncbi:TPA: hypothetical protein KKX32_002936 [Legionella pneumophila]|uniref:hypothetical protein n=1 Tax=Legionella pneumophila TaxID=446 RepID=UPI0007709F26|nr:hypothetical protein [Legionella pneumophila]AMQ27771.1 membrane protein [Legionella pneumophila subsp. pneumophila]MBN5927411.1 hypothetical protein [Legionella pneumophila]PQM72130.1 hypothetical protein C3926_07045 [Legionella pneumophila]QIB24255.1 hypothetical protein GCO85_07545 [Legionella pneumophila]TIG67634.1 hypothetical protein DI132_00550 [Legionella pneumophila]
MQESIHSLFLAQAIGLYLLIVGIIMLSRASYYRELLTHLKEGSATIVTAGSLGLIIGICLVLVHNIWVPESEVLVTLVAWLILIKSILWLGFPEFMVKCSQKAYTGTSYYVISIVVLIIGILLITHGFYLFSH